MEKRDRDHCLFMRSRSAAYVCTRVYMIDPVRKVPTRIHKIKKKSCFFFFVFKNHSFAFFRSQAFSLFFPFFYLLFLFF